MDVIAPLHELPAYNGRHAPPAAIVISTEEFRLLIFWIIFIFAKEPGDQIWQRSRGRLFLHPETMPQRNKQALPQRRRLPVLVPVEIAGFVFFGVRLCVLAAA